MYCHCECFNGDPEMWLKMIVIHCVRSFDQLVLVDSKAKMLMALSRIIAQGKT